MPVGSKNDARDLGAPWNLNRDLFYSKIKQVHQGSDHGIRSG